MDSLQNAKDFVVQGQWLPRTRTRTRGPRTRIRTRTCKLVLGDTRGQGLSSRTTTLEILSFISTQDRVCISKTGPPTKVNAFHELLAVWSILSDPLPRHQSQTRPHYIQPHSTLMLSTGYLGGRPGTGPINDVTIWRQQATGDWWRPGAVYVARRGMYSEPAEPVAPAPRPTDAKAFTSSINRWFCRRHRMLSSPQPHVANSNSTRPCKLTHAHTHTHGVKPCTSFVGVGRTKVWFRMIRFFWLFSFLFSSILCFIHW